MEKFSLVSYAPEIRDLADKTKKTPSEALEAFVRNLILMKPDTPGVEEKVNFHEEGQKWNRLLNDEKVAQLNEARQMFSPTVSSGRSRKGDM